MIRSIQHDWPRALRLLISILGDDESVALRISQAMTDRDWHHFLDLAVDRHRVSPIVPHKIPALDPPQAVSNALDTANQANAMRVLAQLASLKAIKLAFNRVNVPFAVLKGLPLAQQLFGNTSTRIARDIDILVDPARVSEASDLLTSIGLVPELNQQTLIGSAAMLSETSNLSFTHPDQDLMVELHWRCHQFAGWPEMFKGDQNLLQMATSIGELTVPTAQGNLIYLSIHGSMHRWSRLKWLLDIAELSKQRGVAQLEQDIEAAHKVGAARPVELGLYLCSVIFGSRVPTTRYSETSWLPRQCLAEIARPEAVPGDFAQRMKFYAMMFATANDHRQRLGVVRYRLWGKNRLSLAHFRRTA